VGGGDKPAGTDLLSVGLAFVEVAEKLEVVGCIDGGAAESGLIEPVGLGPFASSVGVDDPLPQFVFEGLRRWDEVA